MFENDRYVVTVEEYEYPVTAHGAQYSSGYAVTNKQYAVQEVLTTQLPDAIAAAEQLDIALDNETWKWVRITHDADAINKGG